MGLQFTSGGAIYHLKNSTTVKHLVESIRRYLFLYQTHNHQGKRAQIEYICEYFDLNSAYIKGCFKSTFERALTLPASKLAYRLKFDGKSLRVRSEEGKLRRGSYTTIFKIFE